MHQQLWAANNARTIHVDFTRMVHDKESDLVLIDLLEYCRRATTRLPSSRPLAICSAAAVTEAHLAVMWPA